MLRAQVEHEMPALQRSAGRLALEVLDAEERGIPYIEAVSQASFPLMGRAHHGLLDMLQWRIPPALVEAMRAMLDLAGNGAFDPSRRLLFAIASRRSDPEAALARFLLYQAVRLNLYVRAWNSPELEAWGCIGRIEEETQHVLSGLLAVPEMYDDEMLPLNVLVAEAMLHLSRDAARMRRLLADEMGDVLGDLALMIEATRVVRTLEAADAAVFRPGRALEKLGSQQIADRFPWHFPSANSVDQRRRRFRKAFDPGELPEPPGDRFIDLMLSGLRKEDDE
ncbi:MAG: hypothetical protein EPO40_17575 [Myxococcaceae bacterium]|nr:MAG: hypothetical protein EPO40_17575 [Myxococcaceae bacterium]